MFVSLANWKYDWEKFMIFSGYICRGYPGLFKPNIWNQAEDHAETISHWWILSLDCNKLKKQKKILVGGKSHIKEKLFLMEKIFIHDMDTLVWANNLCFIFYWNYWQNLLRVFTYMYFNMFQRGLGSCLR